MLKLIYPQKDGTVREFDLHDLPAVVGRGEHCAVRIKHKSVSREHLRVFEREGAWHVADLNSSNGSFVNGKKITLAAVHPGDEIRLGAVILTLAGGSSPSTQPGTGEEEQQEAAANAEAERDGPGELVLPGETPAPREETAPARLSPKAVDTPLPGRPEPLTRLKPEEIRVKEQILQYHRQDPNRGRSFLRNDFSQYGGTLRLFLIASVLALAVGAFFLFKWLGEKVTPDDLRSTDGIRGVEEEEDTGE